jgi:hypothetical protein
VKPVDRSLEDAVVVQLTLVLERRLNQNNAATPMRTTRKWSDVTKVHKAEARQCFR